MTDIIRIETGIPLPAPRRPASRKGEPRSIYPFEDMEIGESFFVPGRDARYVQTCISQWRKRGHNRLRQFLVAPAQRKGESGVRCWRTS